MDGRIGLIFLFVLVTSWACDARELVATNLLTEETRISVSVLEGVSRKENVCLLCEEFASEALNYLAQNKTQTEIITILQKSCSKMHSLKMECITLVDYFAPLFFLEISSMKADDFCERVNLCEEVVSYSKQISTSSCGFCQYAVSEVVSKLKDPDTQLDIMQLLLKECSAVEKYLPKCNRMVFEYAPLILSNAEQFLETSDICTMLRACDSPSAITQDLSLIMGRSSSGLSKI